MFFLHILILYHLLEEVIFTLYYLYTTTNIIIEIKCTRSSMSVKQLTEELGSDAFHYKTKNLYLFIYDKEDIIKNPEAYQNAFQRDYEKDGKNVRVFITKTLI